VERCNQLPVHPRHPYAGDAVIRAKSGERQGVAAHEPEVAEAGAADRREWSGVDEESVAA
jgi:2-isopropylmalate synthase